MKALLLVAGLVLAAQAAHAAPPSFQRLMVASAGTQKSAPLTMADGFLKGSKVAKVEIGDSAPGWGGGAVAGFFGGPLGVAMIYALTEGDDPKPKTLKAHQGKNSDFQLGFRQGYRETYRKEKKQSRLAGGILGTGILILAYAMYEHKLD